MIVRRPPQKSASVTTALVTLQREPPLTRIFAPGRLAPSSSSTVRPGLARLAKIAVASPAAPAPTTATSHERKWSVLRRESLARKGVRCGHPRRMRAHVPLFS